MDTLDDEPIEDVANRLFTQWGIGKKGKDEGLLLLLAIKDHKQRVEVGYGLEPIITDGYAGGVLRGIRPILRQGNYGGALLAGGATVRRAHRAKRRASTIEGAAAAAARSRDSEGGGGPFGIIFGFVMLHAVPARIGGGGRRRRRRHGLPDRHDSR